MPACMKLRHNCVCLSVHLFLESISGCLVKDAILVCIHPLVIGGKPVEEKFLDYEPMKMRLVSDLLTKCTLMTESHQIPHSILSYYSHMGGGLFCW